MEEWSIVDEPDESIESEREMKSMSAAAEQGIETDEGFAQSLMAFVEKNRKKLDDREERLKQREEALKKALEGVESEKKLMAGRTPKDILTLNVGGKKILVKREVLCQYKDSLLAAHFSGTDHRISPSETFDSL